MPVRQYKEIELLVALAKLAARERKTLSDLIFEAVYEYLENRDALPPQHSITPGRLVHASARQKTQV
uniref:Uncharacterized protein n=1 Tax=Thermofilum pendens TaxID=2269 RepID=A0A7J3X987_THEPE